MELVGQHAGKKGVTAAVTLGQRPTRNTIRQVQVGLRVCTLLVGLIYGLSAQAVGLGVLHLKSALSHPLQAQVDLISTADADLDRRCYQAKAMSLDGSQLAKVGIEIKTDGAPALILSTAQAIDEPAFSLDIEYTCGSQSRREYQVLLDLMPISPAVVDAHPVPAATTPAVPEKRALEAPTQFSVGTTIAVDPEHVKKTKHHRNATEIVPSTEFAKTPPLSNGENGEVRHKKAPSKKYKNVLKLSDDDNVDTSLDDTQGMHLSMSRGLFGSSATPSASEVPAAPGSVTAPVNPQDGAVSAATPNAAATNGQAPAPGSATGAEAVAPPPDAGLQALQAKIHVLEAQTEELRKLNATHIAELEAAQKAKTANVQVISLYFLLFASFIAIVWLVWRTRQIQSDINDSHWHQIVPENEERSGDVSENTPEPQAEEDHSFLDTASVVQNVTSFKPFAKLAAVEKMEEAEDDFVPPAPQAQPVQPVQTAAVGNKYAPTIQSALPDAEEILDEIQQAEFWMEMQQPERAIEILESNWGGDRPSSPLPWLYLLDLYRQVRDREKYEELTERFEHIFNGKVSTWDENDMIDHSRSLEEFPFVMKKIIELWPTEDLVPFMENLLIDDRDGRRQGFDLAAYRDILFLTNVAYAIQDEGMESKAPQTAPEWSLLN